MDELAARRAFHHRDPVLIDRAARRIYIQDGGLDDWQDCSPEFRDIFVSSVVQVLDAMDAEWLLKAA